MILVFIFNFSLKERRERNELKKVMVNKYNQTNAESAEDRYFLKANETHPVVSFEFRNIMHIKESFRCTYANHPFSV